MFACAQATFISAKSSITSDEAMAAFPPAAAFDLRINGRT